jgi:hypothetical protein
MVTKRDTILPFLLVVKLAALLIDLEVKVFRQICHIGGRV